MKSSGLIFCSLFILNILDCLTGWYKAKVLKKENSKSGYKGIELTHSNECGLFFNIA